MPKRQEREQRILDAAAELIQRWGYNKTTIDDIAKQAGVAKGTIYLHWKTREELFRALMLRENLTLTAESRQRIASDPEGSTLHAMMKHVTLATMQRPLMKAVFLGDTAMLGELTRKEYSKRGTKESVTGFREYLEFLRERGLVRTDIGLREQVYLLVAISMGFLLVEPFLPDEFKLSDEEAVEMLAETIRRTFGPQRSMTSDELQEASHVLNEYLDHAVDNMQEENQQETAS